MPLVRAGGYGHRIRQAGDGMFWIAWSFDIKHGRIRYPQNRSRHTDRKGAERFAKRWDVPMPVHS